VGQLQLRFTRERVPSPLHLLATVTSSVDVDPSMLQCNFAQFGCARLPPEVFDLGLVLQTTKQLHFDRQPLLRRSVNHCSVHAYPTGKTSASVRLTRILVEIASCEWFGSSTLCPACGKTSRGCFASFLTLRISIAALLSGTFSTTKRGHSRHKSGAHLIPLSPAQTRLEVTTTWAFDFRYL
jgi:hypothetical protein